jgi:hypothetical protein
MHLRLAAVLFICIGIAAPAAEACSRRTKPTDAQLFSEAESVFVARVLTTKVRRASRWQCDAEEVGECEYVEGRYELVDVLKGAPRSRGKVRDLVFGPGNCSLGLLAGFYYVFYVNNGDNFVLHIDGSFPLGPTYEDRERQAAERIREPPHERPDDDE